ncbi:unnamed protein product, partial [Effrenium voratum]
AFQVNTEAHLQPVLCSSIFDDEAKDEKAEEKKDDEGILTRHHLALLKLIAKEAGCEPAEIVDADLCLMDAQASRCLLCIFGLACTWVLPKGQWTRTPSSQRRSSSLEAEAMPSNSLPDALLRGPLSKPENFQDRFLVGFIKFASDQWSADSTEDRAEPAQSTVRAALVAAVDGFLARGTKEVKIWESYVQAELGRIIGDPQAFDLRIKIVDNGARKAQARTRGHAEEEQGEQSKARDPSNLVGLYKEFISSPRIDNQLSTWGAFEGLCDFAKDANAVAEAKDVCLAVSFDHEEVGSQSFTGADGVTLPVWLDRVMDALAVSDTQKPEVLARSFMVSADCAHACHPNYAAKHQAEHRPFFHKGIVIKTNANQRYATTPLTAALFREVCKRSDVPVQDFVVRNDSPCGSTIGPIISSKTG